MLIRNTPKNTSKYIMINNSKIICELAEIGIMPKFMDNEYTYFVKTKKLEKYLNDKEQEQWME